MNGLKMGSAHIICVQSDDPPPCDVMNIIGCASTSDTQVSVALTQLILKLSVALTQPKLA
jgi:hypothetical protein